jgi:hypothetical protein
MDAGALGIDVRFVHWMGAAVISATVALLLNGVFSVVIFHDRILGGPYWS